MTHLEQAERLLMKGSPAAAARAEQMLREAIGQGPPVDLSRGKAIERLHDQAWRIRSRSWALRTASGGAYDASGAEARPMRAATGGWEA